MCRGSVLNYSMVMFIHVAHVQFKFVRSCTMGLYLAKIVKLYLLIEINICGMSKSTRKHTEKV